MPNNKMSSSSIGRRMRPIRATPEALAAQAQQHVPQLVVRPTNRGGETLQVAMGGTAIERSMVNMGSIAVYHVKPVVSTDKVHGKKSTIFAVHVQNAITGRSWVVHRRYSDFMMLRGLVAEHFKLFGDEFPRISGLVDELYFPKKHKFRHKMGKVVEHRCDAFLEYLMGLHRLLICQNYLARRDISPIGLSILRGFLGSAIVQDPSHKAYTFHKAILPIELNPADRAPINQCGSLTTVLEDDAEYEVEVEEAVEPEPEAEVEARDGSEGTEDSLSEDLSDGEDTEEEMMRISEIVDRRRSHKYARNRRVLLFLRKDGVSNEPESPTSPSAEESTPCTPRPGNRIHTDKMYVRASEMLRPSEMVAVRMSDMPAKTISA
ncbi:P-type ATPase (P-ATPase) Superfamily [Phytophthora cinnamomi]|uniref:P-type ATPase (P-ATPase) Superfamily n=1 Tax=Phytophthora cinnamomi TaxID=4785 RepID=UPI0035595FC9|nr:P-type ATPase (P-ATPase) Superfamily [Phytophthora cinnamomi]